MSTLQAKYKNEIVPKLQERLGIRNALRIPRLTKVVVNMGFGVKDKDVVKRLAEDLAAIVGQKPVMTKARKSISNFKLRKGMTIGAMVTLRGERMYEFVERLIGAGLPRIRDFRGVSPRGFDGHGNYTLGLKEQTIFPEIDANNVKETQGMDVTFVTTTESDKESRELLGLLGMPFSKN
jgi:large subunit ribosomal protein L5